MKLQVVDGAAIQTREDMERLVGEISALTIKKDTMKVQMDGYIQEVRERYEADLGGIDSALDEKMKLAKTWAQEHPEEFGKAKSLEMTHGIVGFRTGTPKLKTLKGWNWDRVLSSLKELNLGYLIRKKEDVNKEAILAEATKPRTSKEMIAAFGVEVVQDETFFVEPKRETMAESSRISA
jgi:phage host-nuclease inhibitor protein Gam